MADSAARGSAATATGLVWIQLAPTHETTKIERLYLHHFPTGCQTFSSHLASASAVVRTALLTILPAGFDAAVQAWLTSWSYSVFISDRRGIRVAVIVWKLNARCIQPIACAEFRVSICAGMKWKTRTQPGRALSEESCRHAQGARASNPCGRGGGEDPGADRCNRADARGRQAARQPHRRTRRHLEPDPERPKAPPGGRGPCIASKGGCGGRI
jgi:hypothetical protein